MSQGRNLREILKYFELNENEIQLKKLEKYSKHSA